MKPNYEEKLAEGEKLCDLALEEAHHGHHLEALDLFNQAEQAFQSLNHAPWLTFIQHEKLSPLKSLNRQDDWLEATNLALSGYRELNNDKGLCLLLLFVAHQAQEAQEDHIALMRLQEAEAIAIAQGVTELIATIQARLAVQLLLSEDYAQAGKKLNAALDSFTPEMGERYWVFEKLAFTYRALSLFPQAEEAYLNAIEGYLQLNEKEAARAAIEDLLSFYQKAGRNKEAKSLVKRLDL